MTNLKRKNLIRTTTDFAMHIIGAYVKPGDTVVDATCGNGHDTLSLARMVMGTDANPITDKIAGKIYAFDIQEQAIYGTRKLLKDNGFSEPLSNGFIELIHDSHVNIRNYVPCGCSAIIFNLGYLPGSDRNITTEANSTLSAIRNILGMDAFPPLLAKDGILCITIYSGHEAGAKEKARLLEFATEPDPGKYHTAYISMPNQENNPPEIFLISVK